MLFACFDECEIFGDVYKFLNFDNTRVLLIFGNNIRKIVTRVRAYAPV